jgi:transposase InsO family protein
MEEVKVKGKRKVSPPKKRKYFTGEYRLRLVKLAEEESIPHATICREAGISPVSLDRWIRRYRRGGAKGLENHRAPSSRGGLSPAVKERIVAIKKAQPESGVRRISDFLHRMFFLPGSPESVRKTLVEEGLNSPPQKTRRRNVTRPRFFERTTPNQMWQTDIFTFRLGGRYAYLIGFIDDYSRYMVGLGFYLSQTAQNVIEVYRKATTEYGLPKEMLTDNGRQYTSWHGTSKFEAELKKDRIHHIKSQPHHPMTLGKIERFWKTIFEEFLSRAQFESFENAQERVRCWVKYYNHRRPHQGIGGLCPADRYFEIQSEVRKTIESGIQENLLEIALRGKPKDPFYLIGRMEGQSVVLRAEKGKLKLTVDGSGDNEIQETEYTIPTGDIDGKGKTGQEGGEAVTTDTTEETHVPDVVDLAHVAAEERSGAGGMVGTSEPIASMQGNGDKVDYFKPVAGTGTGGDAASVGTTESAGQRSCPEPAITGHAAQETGGVLGEEAHPTPQGDPGTGSTERIDCNNGRVTDGNGSCETSGGSDPAGTQRNDQRERGSEAAGRVAQDVLRVGTQGAVGSDGCADGWGRRPARHGAGRPGVAGLTKPDSRTGEGSGSGEADCRSSEGTGALRATVAVAVR